MTIHLVSLPFSIIGVTIFKFTSSNTTSHTIFHLATISAILWYMCSLTIRLSIYKISFISITITIFYYTLSLELSVIPVTNIKLYFMSLRVNLLTCTMLNPFSLYLNHVSSILFTINIIFTKLIIDLPFNYIAILLNWHSSIGILSICFNFWIIHSFENYRFIFLHYFLKRLHLLMCITQCCSINFSFWFATIISCTIRISHYFYLFN